MLHGSLGHEGVYVKAAARRIYLYQAIDQFDQVIDVLVSQKRDLTATRWFFIRALDDLRPRERQPRTKDSRTAVSVDCRRCDDLCCS